MSNQVEKSSAPTPEVIKEQTPESKAIAGIEAAGNRLQGKFEDVQANFLAQSRTALELLDAQKNKLSDPNPIRLNEQDVNNTTSQLRQYFEGLVSSNNSFRNGNGTDAYRQNRLFTADVLVKESENGGIDYVNLNTDRVVNSREIDQLIDAVDRYKLKYVIMADHIGKVNLASSSSIPEAERINRDAPAIRSAYSSLSQNLDVQGDRYKGSLNAYKQTVIEIVNNSLLTDDKKVTMLESLSANLSKRVEEIKNSEDTNNIKSNLAKDSNGNSSNILLNYSASLNEKSQSKLQETVKKTLENDTSIDEYSNARAELELLLNDRDLLVRLRSLNPQLGNWLQNLVDQYPSKIRDAQMSSVSKLQLGENRARSDLIRQVTLTSTSLDTFIDGLSVFAADVAKVVGEYKDGVTNKAIAKGENTYVEPSAPEIITTLPEVEMSLPQASPALAQPLPQEKIQVVENPLPAESSNSTVKEVIAEPTIESQSKAEILIEETPLTESLIVDTPDTVQEEPQVQKVEEVPINEKPEEINYIKVDTNDYLNTEMGGSFELNFDEDMIATLGADPTTSDILFQNASFVSSNELSFKYELVDGNYEVVLYSGNKRTREDSSNGNLLMYSGPGSYRSERVKQNGMVMDDGSTIEIFPEKDYLNGRAKETIFIQYFNGDLTVFKRSIRY